MSWRIPRFTTLQLLLAAALCALLLGLATGSWRASAYSQVTAVRFSPDGKYLAARYASSSIQVWDVSDARARRVAAITSSSPWAYDNSGLHFANNETLIDVPCRWNGVLVQGEVRTLSLASGSLESRFACQTTAEGMLYAAAGDTFACMDWPSRSVHCYSLQDTRLVQRIPAAMPGWGYSLTPNGRTLVMPDQTGAVTVFDVASGSVLHREPAQGLVAAALSSDGGRLAVVSWTPPGGLVRVRDLKDSTELRIFSPDVSGVQWVGFAADGSQLATAGYDAAELYDVNTGHRIARVVFDDAYATSRWSPLGTTWLSGGGPGHFSLSPDGRTLASFDGPRVLLWDLPGGQPRRTINSDSRMLQIILFVALFALWSAAWGIIARRQHVRELGVHANATLVARVPIELKLCWGMMLIGGLVALAISIAALFLVGTFVWPMMYVSLVTGVAAIACGAARQTRGLERVATLQLLNVAACDPVNFVLGTLAYNLLRRPHVRQYLQLQGSAAAPVSG